MASLDAKETLRVLLVSVSEALRNEVGEALTRAAGEHRLYWVSQPELATVRAQDLVPHVILVDENLGGTDAVSLIVPLVARWPDVAILALVENGAMNRARQVVLAGARGFVTKPIQAEDLASTLRLVLAQRRGHSREPEEAQEAKGRIIVFCAPKGGTGRTTLAVNTALGLHAASQEPMALVDADYAAPAVDVVMNLHSDRDISDLLPKIGRLDDDLINGVLVTHASGVRVLLAPPPADLANPISLPQVQQVLSKLKRMFHWVIVDLGLPLDETAFAFLDGADRIIMTVLPEMVGLRNTRLMLDELHERGYPAEKVWIVLNRASMAGGISKHDIEERLLVRLTHTVPDDGPLVTHSVNRGVPVMMSRRGGAVKRAMNRLVHLLMQDAGAEVMPAATTEAAQRGFLSRLRGGRHAARA